MESIDEILDLDEFQEVRVDAALDEFMSKDKEIANLLKDKIDELNIETDKLTKKREEISDLEESNRNKINSNASPEELIEIAGKLKESEEELNVIIGNIEKLEKEKQELTETKTDVENSKKEYVKNLKSTNSVYDEQLKKINEAIEICDNPALKQALSDVKDEKSKQLESLQEKRNNELKSVLGGVENTKETIDIDSSNNTVLDSPVIIEDNYVDKSIDNFDKTILDSTLKQDNEILNNDNSNNMINIDSILSNNDIKEDLQEKKLNVIDTDNIVIPDVSKRDIENEDKIRIIYEKNVNDLALKQIYNSGYIVPKLYTYLNDNKKGGVL